MLLSDVCLSRTSGLTREQRGLGRLKWGSPGHTWLGHHFKGQRSRSCFGWFYWQPNMDKQ